MPPETLPPPPTRTRISRGGVRIFIQIVLLLPLLQMLPVVFLLVLGVPALAEEARWAAAASSAAAPCCAVALLASVFAPSRWHPVLIGLGLGVGLIVTAWLAFQWLAPEGHPGGPRWEWHPVYLFGGTFTVALWNLVRIATALVKKAPGTLPVTLRS